MERVFIGATRAEATRMADEWWGSQKGLRQTLRTEVAVGRKGPDAQGAAGTKESPDEEPKSPLVAEVVLPLLSAVEEECGQALSRISLDGGDT